MLVSASTKIAYKRTYVEGAEEGISKTQSTQAIYLYKFYISEAHKICPCVRFFACFF